MSDVRIQASRNEQSKQDKKNTLSMLLNKKPRQKTVKVNISGEEVELVFQAISSKELDALQSKHTPTVDQRSRGMVFNIDTFAPALVSACSHEPEITPDEAKAMWESEAWSTGELQHLFDACSSLCMEGLDIPFTGTD